MRLILLLFFFSQVAQAVIVYEYNEEEIPIELKYMLNTLSTYNQENPEGKVTEINETIKSLNQFMSKFQKGENYFFIKTETYKAIYELSPGQRFQSTQLTFPSGNLQTKFGKVKESYPFIYWMIIGLINDYRKFREKNDNNSKLSTPWLNYFNENDPAETKDQIQNLILSILQRIIEKYEFYAVAFENLEQGGLPIKIMKKEEGKKAVPIEEIAETVVKKATKKYEDSFDYKSLTLSELFPDPDPSYTPPENLPEPVKNYSEE